MDAFTTSDGYPYARRYTLGDESINYMRNSVKVLIDAYTGQTTFYVFDAHDPVIAAYRAVFPSLFADAAAMPAAVRKHVRYPELLLNVQAAVYGLYHMTNPDVFYNREDLWSVATEIGMPDQRQQVMEPNFVLMTLPGERSTEFIAILPFTPANRNNLIGWIAGRSDGEHYGEAVVYDFPKTKLIDGPLQIEARIDQNAQLSGQLTLVESAGLARAPRQPDRHSDRAGAALRGAHLPAGGSQSHAGAAVGGARGAGSPRLRADVRIGDGRAVRDEPLHAQRASVAGRSRGTASEAPLPRRGRPRATSRA